MLEPSWKAEGLSSPRSVRETGRKPPYTSTLLDLPIWLLCPRCAFPIHSTAGGWMFQQQEGQPSVTGAAERRASHLTVFTLLLCTVSVSKCEEWGGCRQGGGSVGFLAPPRGSSILHARGHQSLQGPRFPTCSHGSWERIRNL